MKKRLLLILFLSYSFCNGKTINYLVDLNGVVLEQSTYAFTRNVGWFNFIGAYNPINLQSTLFHYHHCVQPLKPDTPRAYYRNRFLISQIQCDYLRGFIDSKTILEMINKKLDEKKPTIDSKRKVELIRSISTVMFTPELFAQTIVRLKDGYRMVKWINGHNTHGSTDHHRIIFVSNWDKQSYPLLYQNSRIRKLFSLAEDIVISGKIGLMKPDPAFYKYVFNEFDINPEKDTTFYIDDERCNIESAQKMNCPQLIPIHYTSFKNTKKIIKKNIKTQ